MIDTSSSFSAFNICCRGFPMIILVVTFRPSFFNSASRDFNSRSASSIKTLSNSTERSSMTCRIRTSLVPPSFNCLIYAIAFFDTSEKSVGYKILLNIFHASSLKVAVAWVTKPVFDAYFIYITFEKKDKMKLSEIPLKAGQG